MRGKKIQGYVITRQLGAGGMGQVFEGLRDPQELLAERKSDASGIIQRLRGKKPEQNLEQVLNELGEQISRQLFEQDTPSKRTEFYQAVLKRIDPALAIEECRRAIKIMKPKQNPSKDEMRSSERFKVETEAQSRVNHPNVARVFGGGETTISIGSKQFPIQYLVMEYVDVGKDLDKGAFENLHEAVRVAYEALKGVEAIHANGFLHRDIKPINILYAKNGEVKVTDFGLVKAINKDSTLALSLTAEGNILGTPHFMPPEVIRGEDATQLSDIYSLGGTLYYLATGKKPVSKTEIDDAKQIVFEIGQRTETVPWVRRRRPEVSAELERLIMKMLAKNPEERLTLQEAKEEMESIIGKGLYVYEEPTFESEMQRRQKIEDLRGEIRKSRSDHKALASLYEQMGMLYTADTHEEINARIDAFEQAIHHNQRVTGIRTAREKISRLKKETAFEHRRIAELNKDLPKDKKIARIQKKPRNPRKISILAAAALAGLAAVGYVGNILLENYGSRQQQTARAESFNSSIAEVNRALERKDYTKALAEIKKAEEEAKLLPGTYAMKIREVSSKIENAQAYDKAAASYARAKESTGRKDFSTARASAENGNSLEGRISDMQLRKKLDEAKLELVESVHKTAEELLQSEEPRGAATGLAMAAWLLDKTTSPDLKERVQALRAKVGAAESRMAQYTPQIKIFEEQVQTLDKLNSDYNGINEQLKQNKFCKREEIGRLDSTINELFSKLSSISQNAVGREEYNKQSLELVKARNRIETLKKDYDSQLIEYLAQQSLKIEQLTGIEDYTRADVPEKLKAATEAIQAAKAQYENARNVGGFAELEQKINTQAARVQSLQEKTLIYTALVRQTMQGTQIEKTAANTNLLKIYIGFGRMDEAEKCLVAIPDKTGLETYALILELERNLGSAQTLPERLTEEMETYTAWVNAYKKDNKLADKMKLYVALVAHKTGANMNAVQVGISDAQELEDQITELKKKSQTETVKRQVAEQNKLLDEKRKTVYALLDSYSKQTGSPKQDAITQLQNAYRAAGYEKRAAEVPQRFK